MFPPSLRKIGNAVGLCCTAAVLCTTAKASVIQSGLQDLSLPADFAGIYLDFTDLNDATTFTTATTEPATWDINFFFGGSAIANSDTLAPVRESAAVNTNVVNLAPGTLVDGSSPIYDGFSGSQDHVGGLGTFTNGVEGYFGFTIEFAGAEYPGWARVTLYDEGTAGTLHEWAWQTTSIADGGSILVGVPEPSEALVILCGLSGMLFGIRRRKVSASRS